MTWLAAHWLTLAVVALAAVVILAGGLARLALALDRHTAQMRAARDERRERTLTYRERRAAEDAKRIAVWMPGADAAATQIASECLNAAPNADMAEVGRVLLAVAWHLDRVHPPTLAHALKLAGAEMTLTASPEKP